MASVTQWLECWSAHTGEFQEPIEMCLSPIHVSLPLSLPPSLSFSPKKKKKNQWEKMSED